MASHQFSAWLKAFNSQDRETILSYHAEHFPYDVSSGLGNIDLEVKLSEFTGGFDIADIVESKSEERDTPPHALTVILHSRQNSHYAKAKMTVDPKNSKHPVIKFDIDRTHTPLKFVPDDRREEYERALAPLTPQRRRVVVEGILDVFREIYVNPVVGKELIGFLEVKLEGGDYEIFTDSEEFARQLLKDTRSFDLHSGVLFREPHPPEESKNRRSTVEKSNGDDDDNKKCAELYDRFKKINFAFDKPSIEPIGTKRLGILRSEGFIPLGVRPGMNCTEMVEAIGSLVSQIADTDALIIDLRFNTGGSLENIALIESYLVGGDGEDDIVHLFDVVDRNRTVKQSIYTLPPSKLPPNTTRFGPSRPLFVLTSKRTLSAGEAMAYDLQVHKRARAIISRDKTTAGAGNGAKSGPRFIAEEEFGKEWWVVLAPDVTLVSPVTGTGWEGVGVIADVVVGKDEDVMDVARDMARKALDLDKNMEFHSDL